MRNVTITLDEEVARWARVRAAEEDTSLSRLVGELLRQKMLDENNYRTSTRSYLARPPRALKKKGANIPTASHSMTGRVFVDTNVLV